jgi:tetratricopeptide (TPR) repeat protein
VAALDNWAHVKKVRRNGSEEPVWVVARLADDDPWRQQLRDPEVRKDRLALERLTEAEGVLAQPQGNLVQLTWAIDAVKGRAAAVRLLRRAQRHYPADFWINFELALRLPTAEAIGFYRAALALRPRSPVVYNILGAAFRDQKELPEAEAAYRKAIALKPNHGIAYCNLGTVLYHQGKLSDAVASYRKAIQLKPDYALSYSNLGNALRDQNNLSEAVAACRKAIELKPDYANAYTNLANALVAQKKLSEAEAAYRKAIEFKPDHAIAYSNLGSVLYHQRKLPEAVVAYRKALELKPDYAVAYNNLGNALQLQGQLAEAVGAYRKATELKRDYAEAYCNLGHALRELGQFADALDALKRGHELGSQDPHWPYPSHQWVRQAQRLVELDAKLPQLLKGETRPANAAECLEIASLCGHYKKHHVAAVRFYREAFAAEPKWAGEKTSRYRYDAACDAALAGCGQGKDVDHLNALERARLRKQALDWLRGNLTALRNIPEKDKEKAPPVVFQRMQRWLDDTDFNCVRAADALAKLPEAERADWQRLWEEVAALRQRAQPKEK